MSNKTNEIIKKQNALQQAKKIDEAKAPVDAFKSLEDATNDKPVDAPVSPAKTDSKETDDKEDKEKASKRLTRKEWVAIIDQYRNDATVTADDIAEKHGVTTNNVYQWSSKLNAEAKAEQLALEAAKLTPVNVIEDIKKLLEGVDGELEAFDAKVNEAKAFIAESVAQRKEIEGSRKKYKDSIELLGGTVDVQTADDKAKD